MWRSSGPTLRSSSSQALMENHGAANASTVYARSGKPAGSMSFLQRPDIAIEVLRNGVIKHIVILDPNTSSRAKSWTASKSVDAQRSPTLMPCTLTATPFATMQMVVDWFPTLRSCTQGPKRSSVQGSQPCLPIQQPRINSVLGYQISSKTKCSRSIHPSPRLSILLSSAGGTLPLFDATPSHCRLVWCIARP